jgi:glycosyltransferase involved in cell wall biosynthesis
MSTIRVSGCIITQGAPELLEKCIEDMHFADEIIVVDGGPDESTRKFVERIHKAVYISNPWPNNISTQRNVYMRAARGSWIFTMDTDERLSSDFGQNVEDWTRRDDLDGFCFPRCWRAVDENHFVLSQYHYPDPNLRLFRNRPETRYLDGPENAVHHALIGINQPISLLHSPLILHDCFLLETRQERVEKMRLYDAMSSNQSGSRYKPFYLYEDFPHTICPISRRPPLNSLPAIIQVNSGR